MALSDEATQVINLARDLRLVSEPALHTLQTLFTHRINTDLMRTLIIGKEATLVDSLFAIMRGAHGPATLGYTLRFTADLCQLCGGVAAGFAHKPATASGPDPATFFADVIDTYREELGVFDPAIFLLGCVLARETEGIDRTALVGKFVAVVSTTFSAAETTLGRLEYCICATAAFLRLAANRAPFQRAGLVPHVTRLLTVLLASDAPTVVQSVYELLLCARLLSFDYEMLGELQRCRIIPVCHRALQRASKEKCVRMALYVLKNFAAAETTYREAQRGNVTGPHNIMTLTRLGRSNGPNFLTDMVGVALPKTLAQLARRKWGDTDINAELEQLLPLLDSVQAGSTSWSEYKGELDSGVLEWSPCHTQAKFWKENIKRIEENGFDCVRQIGEVIMTSNDAQTLAVACNDLGEMIRFHPTGHLITTLPSIAGVKERVMTLMSHEHHDVSKHALACVKKMLVLRWE